MKKYISYIGLVIFSTVLFSCNKDSFNYKDGYVGISKITYFPAITTNGDHLVIIKQGDVYTDQGATAKLNGADFKYVTTGTVNSSTPGIYSITYTGTNPDGFSASDFRTVVVIGNDVAANDFSGNYARDTNGSVAVWTKVSSGVYTVSNPGGAPGTNLIVTVVNYTGKKIAIPQQLANDGTLTSSASESTTSGTIAGTLAQYSMIIVNGGYGASVRNFAKQ